MIYFNYEKKSPLLAQNEVRADIFSGSLAVFQSERVASAGGRKGSVGGIPPAEPSQFRSDIFKQTPQQIGIQISAKNMVGAKRRLFCIPPKNPESERVRHAPRGSSFANTKL